MTDEVDRANDETERYLAERIRLAAQATPAAPLGVCLFCEADLSQNRNRRFCDQECAADWEHEQRVLRRTGGA